MKVYLHLRRTLQVMEPSRRLRRGEVEGVKARRSHGETGHPKGRSISAPAPGGRCKSSLAPKSDRLVLD